MGWLISLVTGPLLGKVLDYFQTRANNELVKHTSGVQADTQVILAQVNAEIENRKTAANSRLADRGSLWTAWMLPTAFGIFMFHAGAIVLDSMPLFGHVVGSWKIAELPGGWTNVQQNVILGVGGIVGVQAVVRRIFK